MPTFFLFIFIFIFFNEWYKLADYIWNAMDCIELREWKIHQVMILSWQCSFLSHGYLLVILVLTSSSLQEWSSFILNFADAIKVFEDGDLQTLGLLDYDKRLGHSFTAHPKVDPFTGEAIFKWVIKLSDLMEYLSNK